MAWFLAKTDPETYSIEQFSVERKTVWDGVTNAQAVQFIRTMKRGDKVFVYHSGGVSAIVGLAKVIAASRPDASNPKSWVVDLAYAGRVDPPLTLAEIRAAGQFGDWLLLRQSRLSTMPAPESFVEWVRGRYKGLKL